MTSKPGDTSTPLSATALGVLMSASLMSGGISIEALNARLSSSRKTIQEAMQELKDCNLMKSSTSHFGGRFVAKTEITEVGHALVFEYLTGLKKAYWGFSENS